MLARIAVTLAVIWGGLPRTDGDPRPPRFVQEVGAKDAAKLTLWDPEGRHHSVALQHGEVSSTGHHFEIAFTPGVEDRPERFVVEGNAREVRVTLREGGARPLSVRGKRLMLRYEEPGREPLTISTRASALGEVEMWVGRRRLRPSGHRVVITREDQGRGYRATDQVDAITEASPARH